MSNFGKCFICLYWDDPMIFIILLTWYIILIDLWVLNRFFILRKPFFSFPTVEIETQMLHEKLVAWPFLWVSGVKGRGSKWDLISRSIQRVPTLTSLLISLGNTVVFKCIMQCLMTKILFWKNPKKNTTVFSAKEESARMLLESKLEEVYPQV